VTLAGSGRGIDIVRMTNMQLQHEIDAMSEEERFFAAAYLGHLADTKDDAHRMTLTERMLRMNAGQKVPLERLEELHQGLENEGR